ncbi:Alpha-1,2-mannosyltransferase MNN22 [Lachnellula suecica]|uniref:Alpha-1,2-mannosyltransferase MNN22 n=1 Tax=Lachnellula suecica TaxID=602035 RepID=A0A8T9BUZ4_9HELO|nr:Alpha-1,2-mannosyltransferase MNN22 [Lachnellula suecica]
MASLGRYTSILKARNKQYSPLRLLLLVVAFCVVYQIWTSFQHDTLADAINFAHPAEPELADYLEFIQLAHPHFKSLRLHNDGLDKMRFVANVTKETQRLDICELSAVDLEATRLAHDVVVGSLSQSHYDVLASAATKPSTRGIVTIGGDTFTGQVLVQLRMLRRFNAELPVEVFLPEPDEAELKGHICHTLFPALNARCVPLPKVPGHKLSRFAYKAFALLHSTFEDILFLDADNFPIVDPNAFFDAEPYTSTGLVMWPDFWESMVSPKYYEIIHKPVDPMTLHAGSESGQIIVSKKRHGRTLLLALYYSIFGEKQYFYLFNQGGHGEGDKDFWVHAAKALDLPYYQVREATVEMGGQVMEWYYVGIAQSHPGDDYARQLKAPDTTTRVTPEAKIALIHHSWTKLSPAFMILQRYNRVWERMWGTQAQTIEKYGYDLEDEVWQEVMYVGCGAVRFLPAKEDREQCEKLTSIWKAVLGNDTLSTTEINQKIESATDIKRKVRLLDI